MAVDDGFNLFSVFGQFKRIATFYTANIFGRDTAYVVPERL